MQILSNRTGYSGITAGNGANPLSSPLTSNRTHFSTSQHPSQSIYQAYQTYQHHDGVRQIDQKNEVIQGNEAYRRARNA